MALTQWPRQQLWTSAFINKRSQSQWPLMKPRVTIASFKHGHICGAAAVIIGYPFLSRCPDTAGSRELSALLIPKKQKNFKILRVGPSRQRPHQQRILQQSYLHKQFTYCPASRRCLWAETRLYLSHTVPSDPHWLSHAGGQNST